jgi:hypothetical protein
VSILVGRQNDAMMSVIHVWDDVTLAQMVSPASCQRPMEHVIMCGVWSKATRIFGYVIPPSCSEAARRARFANRALVPDSATGRTRIAERQRGAPDLGGLEPITRLYCKILSRGTLFAHAVNPLESHYKNRGQSHWHAT